MTDKPEDEPGRTASRAAAASRARRIGGRPLQAHPVAESVEQAVPAGEVVEDEAPVVAETPVVEDEAPVVAETPVVEDEAPALEPAEAAPAARPRPRPKPPAAAAGAPVSVTKPAPKADSKPKRADLAGAPGGALVSTDWVPAAAAGVIALAFAVLVAVFSIIGGGSKSAPPKDNQLREQVLAAAKTCTARENTYNYKTLAADETAALACTTGDFNKVVKNTFDAVLKVKVPAQQATQQTTIDLAAIERISEDGKDWTILVFGQSSVSNTGTTTTGPRVDPFAAEVTMTKVGTSWLISRLDYA